MQGTITKPADISTDIFNKIKEISRQELTYYRDTILRWEVNFTNGSFLETEYFSNSDDLTDLAHYRLEEKIGSDTILRRRATESKRRGIVNRFETEIEVKPHTKISIHSYGSIGVESENSRYSTKERKLTQDESHAISQESFEILLKDIARYLEEIKPTISKN